MDMNKILHPDELRQHIRNFLESRRNGSLGTCLNEMPRSSPVAYFLGHDLDIYILSAGGEKFRAIEQNPKVCLLVNTEYTDYTRIKGVQVFGEAVTSEDEPGLLHEAFEFCPDCHINDFPRDSIKAIKIIPEEIVYLNSLADGDRTKQILTKEHMSKKKQSFPELSIR
jgi:uncharacterized pyridoxamine 5'-phosphate oxidase family protein